MNTNTRNILIVALVFFVLVEVHKQRIKKQVDGIIDPYKDEQAPIGSVIYTASDGVNNPGNIINVQPPLFAGQLQSNAKFAAFSDIEHGYRAIRVILYHYVNNGYNTLTEILNRYAPPSDGNNTGAYIQYVSTQIGVNPFSDLTEFVYSSRVADLVRAITYYEQGVTWYASNFNETQLQKGINLA